MQGRWYGDEMWKLFASTRVRIAAFVAGIVVTGSAVSNAVNGLESLQDSFAWAFWAYERANTPWLGVFVLVALSALFYSGMRDIVKAEEKGRLADDLVMEEMRNLLREARALPTLLADHWKTMGGILEMRAALEKIDESIGTWKTEIVELKSDGGGG